MFEMPTRTEPGINQVDCKSEPEVETSINTSVRTLVGVSSEDHDVGQSPRKRRRLSADAGHTLSPPIQESRTKIVAEDDQRTSSQVNDPKESLDEESEIARRRAMRAKILQKYGKSNAQPLAASLIATSKLEEGEKNIDLAQEVLTTSPDHGSIPELTQSTRCITSIDDEGPSAADFDADADRIAEHEHHRTQHEENRNERGITPEMKSDIKEDVCADEDDMFADLPANGENDADAARSLKVAQKLDETMLDSWADTEGYYRIMIGELLDGRYAVQSVLGKGVFASVVRAVDQSAGDAVAIKLIRHNDLMRKAGYKEVGILEKLMAADPDDRRHIVRLKRTFEHRGHLCLVFESLSINLREVLKKFGRDIGINLKAVRAYAHQIFMALALMRRCNIMHADLKPDNILVSESRSLLKICDLGSASDVSENALTPYLASRFYRAPEVILGLPYDSSMDVWAVGCTLYEMYTGKILFPGRTNNQMLRHIMECRGKFPTKLLKKGAFVLNHFDEQLNFISHEIDRVSGEEAVRVLNISKATKDFRSRLILGAGPEERSRLIQFVDLLEKTTDLDASKRITPSEALKHPFLSLSSI